MEKYTVVTGASSGIGMAISKMFASRGKNLIIIARREERLLNLKKDSKEKYQQLKIIVKKCDLSDIETWINNVEFGHSKKILEQDLERVSQMIRLNLESVTILSTLYARDYQDKEATLINVSSTVDYGVSSRVPAYSSTKFYVSAFTEELYWEMKEAHKKLRVKVLAPASTASEFSMISARLSKPRIPHSLI